MKSSDYLRAFKDRDLNREIDFAQAKWKEHDHHTFGDFAKWFKISRRRGVNSRLSVCVIRSWSSGSKIFR